jgi:hypothetical protein
MVDHANIFSEIGGHHDNSRDFSAFVKKFACRSAAFLDKQRASISGSGRF